MKKTGFTLAEVLITLGIIGVVAAITIPTIINNTQENETKTAVRAAYSILSQAMQKTSQENGGTIKGLCANTDSLCFKNAFKAYLKYTKECDNQVVTNNCWPSPKYLDNTPINIAGWLDTSGSGAPSALVLSNGMLVLFYWIDTNCSNSGNDTCGWVAVDTNGLKNPNKYGKDIFEFHVQDGVIKPYGMIGDTGNFGTCNSTDTGQFSGCGCAYKYLYQ